MFSSPLTQTHTCWVPKTPLEVAMLSAKSDPALIHSHLLGKSRSWSPLPLSKARGGCVWAFPHLPWRAARCSLPRPLAAILSSTRGWLPHLEVYEMLALPLGLPEPGVHLWMCSHFSSAPILCLSQLSGTHRPSASTSLRLTAPEVRQGTAFPHPPQAQAQCSALGRSAFKHHPAGFHRARPAWTLHAQGSPGLDQEFLPQGEVSSKHEM